MAYDFCAVRGCHWLGSPRHRRRKVSPHRVALRAHHGTGIGNVLPPSLLAELGKHRPQLFETTPGLCGDRDVWQLGLAVAHSLNGGGVGSAGDLVGTQILVGIASQLRNR